jgi:preprotein translocase subunit SecE
MRTLAKLGRPVAKVLRWLLPRYFINSWREVRQVTWPNRRETWRLTGAVFIFALVFGALVAIVDKGIDEIFKKLVLK